MTRRAPTRRALAALLLAACSAEPAAPGAADAGAADAPVRVDAPLVDAPVADLVDAGAASLDAAGGGSCSFNRDCIAAERCECDEVAGCRCAPGARGAGVAGVTPCTSGNDCASALCVEGSGAGSLCSDACDAPADCPAALPRCLSIAGISAFCARDPGARDAGASATRLVATFGARTADFDRAQHGNLDADHLLVEAHFGGDPACPTASSPTPRRTLSLRNLRATADAAPQTEADGVIAVLFDFGGDLTSAPLVRATAVRVVPRAYTRDASVSLTVTATFPGGTITGELVAPHCASLD